MVNKRNVFLNLVLLSFIIYLTYTIFLDLLINLRSYETPVDPLEIYIDILISIILALWLISFSVGLGLLIAGKILKFKITYLSFWIFQLIPIFNIDLEKLFKRMIIRIMPKEEPKKILRKKMILLELIQFLIPLFLLLVLLNIGLTSKYMIYITIWLIYGLVVNLLPFRYEAGSYNIFPPTSPALKIFDLLFDKDYMIYFQAAVAMANGKTPSELHEELFNTVTITKGMKLNQNKLHALHSKLFYEIARKNSEEAEKIISFISTKADNIPKMILEKFYFDFVLHYLYVSKNTGSAELYLHKITKKFLLVNDTYGFTELYNVFRYNLENLDEYDSWVEQFTNKIATNLDGRSLFYKTVLTGQH